MLFAQILQEHRKNQLGILPEKQELLNMFNDVDKSSPFSIQNISKAARKIYNIQPGQWYNPSQIANILAGLFETNCSSK